MSDNVEIIQAAEINTNGIILPREVRGAIDAVGMFASVKGGDTLENKVAVFNATSTSVSMSDEYNTPIDVMGVVIKPTQMTDINTGELVDSIMTVLIDKDGNGHMSHSKAVLSAVMNIVASFGMPDEWPEGMRIVPIAQAGRNGYKYTTLKIAF